MHLCLTVGDTELPTSTHTPLCRARATHSIPTLTVPERMEDKDSSGGSVRSQPRALLRRHTPVPHPNTFVGVPWGILHITGSAGPAAPDITLEWLGTLPGFPGTGTPRAGSVVQPFDRGPGARLPATRPLAQPTGQRSERSASPAVNRAGAPLPQLGGMEAQRPSRDGASGGVPASPPHGTASNSPSLARRPGLEGGSESPAEGAARAALLPRSRGTPDPGGMPRGPPSPLPPRTP